MARTEHYAMRARAVVRDLKRDDECMHSRACRNGGLGGLNAMCQQYMCEAEMLRALPNPNSLQTARLARLEKTIADMQGTLQRTR